MPVYIVFIIFVSAVGVIICSTLTAHCEIFWKKYSLSSHLVEMDDPDLAKWRRSDRILIHNTGKKAKNIMISARKKPKSYVRGDGATQSEQWAADSPASL